MNRQLKYKSVTDLSFGQVETEIVPVASFDDQQVLDAMLVTAHTGLTAWVIDNTIDPEHKNGKQEQINASIKDGQRKIADIRVSVPTTSSFSKAMFDGFLQEYIVPAVQRTVRSYPAARSNQQAAASASKNMSPLAEHILPTALEQTSQISPRQLKRR